MISIIMPSYLGNYKNAAKNREEKLCRAIDSVLKQTYKKWELVIVSDGCEKTIELVKQYGDNRIKGYKIKKQLIWSGIPRNIGIQNAKYNWITYLDIDDTFGNNHLKIISEQLNNKSWYYFNDYVFYNHWRERNCLLKQSFCGTSNLIHKKIALWPLHGNYQHDWIFILNLMQYSYEKIKTPEYYVHHIPGKYDV